MLEEAGLCRGDSTALPFLPEDVTIGSETELQTAVSGNRSAVDLPLTIEGSRYFANVRRRSRTGDLTHRSVTELEGFLASNAGGVWENSWVRLPLSRLSPAARRILEEDLARDKSKSRGPRRSDAGTFFLEQGGESLLRVPVSYLLKLALADATTRPAATSEVLRRTATRLMGCLTNDNSSPETLSFHLVSLAPPARGLAVARESAKRFLLTQLLAAYANTELGLLELGQEVVIYHSPHPPVRLRQLSGCVSDAFFRSLFVSPCLSGWERGEEKRDYMELCHQALSRSHLQALVKLREAGIVTRNLVVLPRASDVSLANNGTHLSFGSHRLTELGKRGSSAFASFGEKLLADLVVKVVEHFLPLCVGTYTAAPYRFEFADFHPERLLGFLPHELDFTHLRMFWRRFKGKAANGFLGRSLTPFGPEPLDHLLAALLRLRGDLVPDLRLIDYPVAWLSTASAPALDGVAGNGERLRADLEALGVADRRMALYLPVRPREFASHGYCGFEARHLSLFEGFARDLAPAATFLALLFAFAMKCVVDGGVSHAEIPDDPEVESERRQAFFCAAAGVPTFYVKAKSPNRFLLSILERVEGLRSSRRYSGYLRVPLASYQGALLALLRREGGELLERFGGRDLLADLASRLAGEGGVAERLTRAVLRETGGKRPLDVPAREFNRAAEKLYRTALRQAQLRESLDLAEEEIADLELRAAADDGLRAELAGILGLASAEGLVEGVRRSLHRGHAGGDRLRKLILLLVLSEAEPAPVTDATYEVPGVQSPWAATRSSSAAPAA